MKIERWLRSEKVRNMCIRYEYYTCGDCRAYERMLGMCDRISADDPNEVKRIAEDIYYHSRMSEDDDDIYSELYSLEDNIAGIMYGLYNECMETLVEIERNEV